MVAAMVADMVADMVAAMGLDCCHGIAMDCCYGLLLWIAAMDWACRPGTKVSWERRRLR